jgi:hypothetical protein
LVLSSLVRVNPLVVIVVPASCTTRVAVIVLLSVSVALIHQVASLYT